MSEKISEEVAREERVFAPVHPGRIIALEWLEPLGLSAYALARAAGVPKQRMYGLMRGERGISADTALRLSRSLGMKPEFWMELQTDYDLEVAEWKDGERITAETRSLIN